MRTDDGPAGSGPGGGHDHAPDADLRCPSCGALRPPAVTWCTQCYVRFDTPEASVAAAPSEPAGTAVAADGDLGEHPDLGPAEPVRRGSDAATVAPEEVEARAEELLARLAHEGTDHGRVRSWSGLVQGNGHKVGAMVVGTLVLTGLLFGVMALVGALL